MTTFWTRAFLLLFGMAIGAMLMLAIMAVGAAAKLRGRASRYGENEFLRPRPTVGGKIGEKPHGPK